MLAPPLRKAAGGQSARLGTAARRIALPGVLLALSAQSANAAAQPVDAEPLYLAGIPVDFTVRAHSLGRCGPPPSHAAGGPDSPCRHHALQARLYWLQVRDRAAGARELHGT
jgi:hypothetical protein